MKHALSFFAGAALIAAAVIWAGGRPAGMFVAGMVLMAITVGCAIRIAGVARVGRFLLTFDSAYNNSAGPVGHSSPRFRATTATAKGSAPPSRAVTPGRREKDNARHVGTNVVSFQKTEVLNTTQQEVVSALCNLGMPFSKAQKIVVEASQGKPGIDFDSLFRACQSNPSRASA